MSRTVDLLVRITGDTAGVSKALDSSQKAASGWSGKLSAGAKVAGAGLLALGGVAVAGAKAAAEDAAAQTQLATAMRNAAGASDKQIASTEDWISKTALAAGVADDELRPALANLVRATGDVTKSQDLMKTAMDVSAATGKPLEAVSMSLAKAYNGNVAALGKLGVKVTESTKDSIAMASAQQATEKAQRAYNEAVKEHGPKSQEAIDAQKKLELAHMKQGAAAEKTTKNTVSFSEAVERMNKQFGGAAAKNADTAAGQYERMKVALGETQETIGALLLPALQSLLSVFQPMLASVSQNTKLVRGLFVGLAALAAVVVTVNAATKAYLAISKLVAVATKAWTIAQWLLNVALRANPIGIVITLIALLVAGIILAYKKSDTFRAIVTGAFKAVAAAASAAFNWIKNNWPTLLAILAGPIGIAVKLIIDNFDSIKAVVQRVWDFISDIVGKIQSAVKKVTGWINSIPKPSIPDLNPFGASVTASAMSTGGPSVRSLGASAPAAGGGSPIVVNVNGALDPDAVARQIRKILSGHDRRTGGRISYATAR